MLECPLCGRSNCHSEGDSRTNAIVYHCEVFARSVILGSEIDNCGDYFLQRKLLNLVFEHVLKNPNYEGKYWNYYYDPHHFLTTEDNPNRINLAEKPYPHTISEKADRTLLNLSRLLSEYSDSFKRSESLKRVVFAENGNEEKKIGFLLVLEGMGYLQQPSPGSFIITAKGWERIDELSRKEEEKKQGFIAMKFGVETQSISEVFKSAIVESGFQPIRIDEVEHNNQIVPEIFYEIDQSKFLVMDVTYPNYGAYYEAGYALGKGKQVIICCRKEEFDSKERPHFDIQQKSTIVWETEDELMNRLIKRIRATVK